MYTDYYICIILRGQMFPFHFPPGAGPEHWAEHWPLCGGTSQSPIDLPGNPQYDPALTKFAFRGFDNDSLGADDLTLMNVGWTGTITKYTEMIFSS